MENNQSLPNEDLEKVSGGYTSEKRSDYNGVPCPFCGYPKVYSITVWEITSSGNKPTWGPYQCENCGKKWRGTRVGSVKKRPGKTSSKSSYQQTA